MAQESYRYTPVRMLDGWYRIDISWRTDVLDDHHFIDEWTGPITAQAATESTHYSIPTEKFSGMNTDELQTVDTARFTFQHHAKIEACLASTNYSAEMRLWFSPDQTNWYPAFWGIIDLNDVHRPTELIAGGTFIKSYTFTVYDAVKYLETIPANNHTQLDASTYKEKTFTAECGGRNIATFYARHGSGSISVLPRVLTNPADPTSGTPTIISILYYLEQPAKMCFLERAQSYTIAAPLAAYGLGSSAVNSPYQYCAFTTQTTSAARITKEFTALYLWHFLLSDDWYNEFDSWAELLMMFCDLLGFVVRTKNTIETGGQWVRTLNYVRTDAANNRMLGYNGVIIKRQEFTGKRSAKRVAVTSRFRDGGQAINEHTSGSGETHNMVTHFHTVGNIGVSGSYPSDAWDQFDALKRRAIFWNTLLVHDSGTLYRLVNQVKIFADGSTYHLPITNGFDLWDEENLEDENGVAQAIAMHTSYNVIGRSKRLIIEETHSSTLAHDGTSNMPQNWAPFAQMADDEYTADTFRVLAAVIDPTKGTAKITKEII